MPKLFTFTRRCRRVAKIKEAIGKWPANWQSGMSRGGTSTRPNKSLIPTKQARQVDEDAEDERRPSSWLTFSFVPYRLMDCVHRHCLNATLQQESQFFQFVGGLPATQGLIKCQRTAAQCESGLLREMPVKQQTTVKAAPFRLNMHTSEVSIRDSRERLCGSAMTRTRKLRSPTQRQGPGHEFEPDYVSTSLMQGPF